MPRITVTFEKSAAERLDRLAKDRSKSDVIREALALEEVYQKALAEGATLVVKTPNGAEREIVRA
jgi:Arc/MetJ-type ribon-helix-helix transcriptional regulator